MSIDSTRFNRWRLPATALLAASALVLTGCASGAGETASVGEASAEIIEIFGEGGESAGEGIDFNVGLLTAVTGQGSYYGEVMSQGSKLAAEQITAAGGPAMSVLVGDHESGQIPAGMAATRKFTSQDDISVLQTSFGAVSEAIAPVLDQSQVLGLQGGGASPGQIGKPFLWMTMSVFGDDSAPGALSYIAENYPDAKRLVVVGTRENGVNAAEQVVPEVWPLVSDGGTVVGTEMHDVGITDFGAVVARVKAQNPDVIYSTDFGNDTGHLVQALRQAGINAPVIINEYTVQACEISSDGFEGVYLAGDYFDPANENPFTKQFVEAYEAKHDVKPEFYAANYYEQLFIVWELIRGAIAAGEDPTSGAALQKQLETIEEFPSLYGGGAGEVGMMTFNVENHTVNKPMGVFQINECVPEKVATIQKVAAGDDPATSLVE